MKTNLFVSAAFTSFAFASVGLYLSYPYKFGLCFSDPQLNIFDVSCNIYFSSIGKPLLYGGLALSVVFVMLLLIPVGFTAWKRFAVWFVPLATLLFIFYPEPGAWDFLSPMPEQLFQWVSVFYVAVSALLIGFVHFTKSR